MDAKTLAHLTFGFNHLVGGAFTFNDIRSLFIDLRPHASSRLLKEIAHFVAHPEERDQGISHREIDLNYIKMRNIAGQEPMMVLSVLSDHHMELLLYGIEQTDKKWAKE